MKPIRASFSKEQKTKGNKKVKILLIICVVLLFICICLPFLKGMYYYITNLPTKDYFGAQYNELLHVPSPSDRQQSNQIMKEIDAAFSFVGTKDEAQEKFGELSQYCVDVNSPLPTRDGYTVTFVTADFQKEDGYLWMKYSHDTSSNILVRLQLKKIGQEWVVVNAKEHP